MPSDHDLLDEIIYARVLITLQRIQLDEQDAKLKNHLNDAVGTDPNAANLCKEALQRAWERASTSLAVTAPMPALAEL